MYLNTFQDDVISFRGELYTMAEEKIVKVNLGRQLKSIPRWKRQIAFARLLRKTLKIDKMKMAQGLNEKIWSDKSTKVRLKIVKGDKSTRVEAVE